MLADVMDVLCERLAGLAQDSDLAEMAFLLVLACGALTTIGGALIAADIYATYSPTQGGSSAMVSDLASCGAGCVAAGLGGTVFIVGPYLLLLAVHRRQGGS